MTFGTEMASGTDALVHGLVQQRLGSTVEEPSRFTDQETARKEGVPHMIIPGIMSMAYLSQLVTDWAPNITLKKLDVIFRAPIKHEEAIQCMGLVTDKEVRDGDNCVDCDLYIENPAGQRAVTGKALVVIPSR